MDFSRLKRFYASYPNYVKAETEIGVGENGTTSEMASTTAKPGVSWTLWIGLVLGAILLTIIIFIVIPWVMERKKKLEEENEEPVPPSEDDPGGAAPVSQQVAP